MRKPVYTIVHNQHVEKDQRLSLCEDYMFRSGYYYGMRGATLIYKQRGRALTVLKGISKKNFPNAKVLKSTYCENGETLEEFIDNG